MIFMLQLQCSSSSCVRKKIKKKKKLKNNYRRLFFMLRPSSRSVNFIFNIYIFSLTSKRNNGLNLNSIFSSRCCWLKQIITVEVMYSILRQKWKKKKIIFNQMPNFTAHRAVTTSNYTALYTGSEQINSKRANRIKVFSLSSTDLLCDGSFVDWLSGDYLVHIGSKEASLVNCKLRIYLFIYWWKLTLPRLLYSWIVQLNR